MLILKPVHHVARACVLGATSSRYWISPVYGCRILAAPDASTIYFSDRIGGVWHWSTPPDSLGNYKENFAELVEIIEKEVVPDLRIVQSVLDVESYTVAHKFMPMSQRRYECFVWLIICGDFDAAIRWGLEELRLHLPDVPPLMEWEVKRREAFRQALAFLKADDRPALAALLRGWERNMLAENKIEHLWQDTPFPFEQVKTCKKDLP